MIIKEGGWDSTATQTTVINPNTVKAALNTMQRFLLDFNEYTNPKGIPPIKMGHPTGSSAYHDVDTPDKIYGDIDLQIIVPETEETASMSSAQAQAFWYNLEDEFVKSTRPDYVHQHSTPGHPIVSAGQNQWVQVDLMPHIEKLATWGRFRATPEHGIKGMLNGNMFSVLGEVLMMSIQYNGVQCKVRDKVKQPYSTTRKNYELVTISTNIETFVKDIFDHEYELITDRDPSMANIDGLLKNHPGSDINNVKISNLVNAVKGLANSFALNDMYGKGDLKNYNSSNDFISTFLKIYETKAMKDVLNTKRDKAATPEAKQRADDDRKKILQGLDMVRGLF